MGRWCCPKRKELPDSATFNGCYFEFFTDFFVPRSGKYMPNQEVEIGRMELKGDYPVKFLTTWWKVFIYPPLQEASVFYLPRPFPESQRRLSRSANVFPSWFGNSSLFGKFFTLFPFGKHFPLKQYLPFPCSGPDWECPFPFYNLKRVVLALQHNIRQQARGTKRRYWLRLD